MATTKMRHPRHPALPNTAGAANPGGAFTIPPNSTTPKTYPRRRQLRLPNSTVTVVKPARRVKRVRSAALGDMVPCCAAEAVAASLRLEGWRVTEEDVLRLHSLAAGRSGAQIEHILDAVISHGLAGVRPAAVEEAEPSLRGGLILGMDYPAPHAVFDDGTAWWSWGRPWEPFAGAVISEAWSVSWSGA